MARARRRDERGFVIGFFTWVPIGFLLGGIANAPINSRGQPYYVVTEPEHIELMRCRVRWHEVEQREQGNGIDRVHAD